VPVGQRTLGHQGVGDRHVEVLGEGQQRLPAGAGAQPAAEVDERALGPDQRGRDALRDVWRDRWRAGVGSERVRAGQPGRQRPREQVHRHVEQGRPGPARRGRPERPLGEPR
jgi:hypothetical protein